MTVNASRPVPGILLPCLRSLLVLGLLLGAGCGLGEYESRMADEQERLRYLDEENKYLEAPLRLPEKKDADKEAKLVLPTEIFVRPPKGVALTPDEKLVGGNLYRFGRTVTNAAVPEIFLAVSKEPTATFQQEILKSFSGASLGKNSKEIKRPAREPLRFDIYRDPQTGLSFFFYRADPYQVALVYRASDATAAAPMIDYSLGSLLVGSAAGIQHRALQGRHSPSSSGSRSGR